jgi:pimeloyl-ACP methyl ester carboxylesterase
MPDIQPSVSPRPPHPGFLALLLLSLAVLGCGQKKLSAIDHLHACPVTDNVGDAYCGTYDVWEDRDAKAGRKISLRIVVLPALKQKPAPDPLFFLAGGPGQGAASLAGPLHEAFRRLQSDRDIVFVDQRGTGKSNPLSCKPSEAQAKSDESDDSEDDAANPAMLVRLRACLESYKDKADVTKYTTTIAMDDLDDVRSFLGYGKINLYGGSYGTRAALVYARRHPSTTRAVILDGVAPTDMRLPLYMARDGQRALDLLARDCAQDAEGCGKRFPKLAERLRTLMDSLAAHPRKVHYVHPRTGLEQDMDVRRSLLAGALFSTLYSPSTSSLVPLLIEQAEKGNYTGFLALGAAFDPTVESIAYGMHFSVVCSEDAPRIQAGDIAQAAAGSLFSDEIAAQRVKICDFWPKGKVDPSYYENAPSDLPALILSGELDPVTPPVLRAACTTFDPPKAKLN